MHYAVHFTARHSLCSYSLALAAPLLCSVQCAVGLSLTQGCYPKQSTAAHAHRYMPKLQGTKTLNTRHSKHGKHGKQTHHDCHCSVPGLCVG